MERVKLKREKKEIVLLRNEIQFKHHTSNREATNKDRTALISNTKIENSSLETTIVEMKKQNLNKRINVLNEKQLEDVKREKMCFGQVTQDNNNADDTNKLHNENNNRYNRTTQRTEEDNINNNSSNTDNIKNKNNINNINNSNTSNVKNNTKDKVNTNSSIQTTGTFTHKNTNHTKPFKCSTCNKSYTQFSNLCRYL